MSEEIAVFPDALILIGAQALANTDWDELPYSLQQYWLKINKSGLDCYRNNNIPVPKWDRYSYGIFKALTRNTPEWWNRETEEGRNWWRYFADRGWKAVAEYED